MSNFNRNNVYSEESYKSIIEEYGNRAEEDDYSGILELSMAPNATVSQGCAFSRIKWLKETTTGTGPGLFSYYCEEGIPISDVARKGDKADLRTEHEGVRCSIQTTVSKSGVYGQAMQCINRAWMQEANRFITERKEKTEGVTQCDMVIRQKVPTPIIRTHLSELNVKTPKAKIDDPFISMKFEFNKTYPERHPFGEKGESVLEFYDARKRIGNKVKNSFKSYQMATVPKFNDDGSVTECPITADNVHEFITKGSKMILFKSSLTSPSANKNGFTMPNKLWKAVILPGQRGQAADEVDADETDLTAELTKTVTEAVTSSSASKPTETTGKATVTETSTTTETVTEKATVPHDELTQNEIAQDILDGF